MEILFFTLGFFAAMIVIMSVGIIFRQKPIKGTCGGIATLMGEGNCDICEKKNECQVEKTPLTH